MNTGVPTSSTRSMTSTPPILSRPSLPTSAVSGSRCAGRGPWRLGVPRERGCSSGSWAIKGSGIICTNRYRPEVVALPVLPLVEVAGEAMARYQYAYLAAPVAQGIEHRPPEPVAPVRIRPGAPDPLSDELGHRRGDLPSTS